MKKYEDLINLSRSPLVNQLHGLRESITKPPPHYDMHGLIHRNFINWILRHIRYLGNRRYAYQQYSKPEANNGIFKMQPQPGQQTTIALLGDWASDTPESHNIANLAGQQDYSIHLGDTYYMGNIKEIADNFNDKFGAPWPYGTFGSFALLGNHEMYSGGKGYFTQLLPYMGVYSGDVTNQQEASYFCLENDHWRIIGLDTGYNSLKGCLGVRSDYHAKLHRWQMEWFNNVVQPNKDNRGIILLSHHQSFSAFEKEYPGAAAQLSSVINPEKTVLWFWGHEHRLAIYGGNQLPNGSNVFARCIGHGGMPTEIKVKTKSPRADDPLNRNLVLHDDRTRTIVGKYPLGHNGYVILKMNGNKLVAEYYDDNNNNQKGEQRLILSETWSVD
ncbi:MAG: metallophosphoesterase, partial [Chitinophagaceae bacterium]